MRIACFGDSLTSGEPGSSYFTLLREQLPGDLLLNYGRSNDTVVSLSNRVSAMQIDRPLDVAFLWIGVNDVLLRDSWLNRTAHTLLGQRRARDNQEFRSYYLVTLDLLCSRAERVIVSPPVLKGENLENHWNHRLAELAILIEDLTADVDQAEFLDLRKIFAQALLAKPVSNYLLTNPFRILLDTLTLRSDEKVDTKATTRGLHLTLDGVHLNSVGAHLVATQLIAAIQNPNGS